MAATPSAELWQESLNFYYPKSLSRNYIYWKAFVDVFDPGLWWAIIVISLSFTICVPIMFLIAKGDEQTSKKVLETFLSSTAIIFKALVCLGYDDSRAQSKKYLKLSLFALSLSGGMVFWHYNSCLISYLTVDTNEPPFKNFEELRKLPESYKIIVIHSGVSEFFIKNLIKEGKIDKGRMEAVFTVDEADQKMLEGRGSFFRSDSMTGSKSINPYN